jgi:hypothetical protein
LEFVKRSTLSILKRKAWEAIFKSAFRFCLITADAELCNIEGCAEWV